jgi:hypothetical protein
MGLYKKGFYLGKVFKALAKKEKYIGEILGTVHSSFINCSTALCWALTSSSFS